MIGPELIGRSGLLTTIAIKIIEKTEAMKVITTAFPSSIAVEAPSAIRLAATAASEATKAARLRR